MTADHLEIANSMHIFPEQLVLKEQSIKCQPKGHSGCHTASPSQCYVVSRGVYVVGPADGRQVHREVIVTDQPSESKEIIKVQNKQVEA